MRKHQKRGGVCAFCGDTSDRLESDHIPPRCLLASPPPANLITVPACPACHRSTTKEDEYLRTVLTFNTQVAEHPDVAGGVLGAALRSFFKPGASRHARAFARTMRPIQLVSPAGLLLGRTYSYKPDGARVLGEIGRFARGLLFYEQRAPLGRAYEVKVLSDELVDWTRVDAAVRETVAHTAGVLSGSPQVQVGRVLQYSRWFAAEDARVSAWRIVLYGRFVFLALTGPLLQREEMTQ